jgi:DNA ligase (NAD+)
VRGEVYQPVSVFLRLNQELAERDERPFANPRNAAAGSLRQKDPAVTAARGLSFWCYGAETNAGRPGPARAERHSDDLEYLRSVGLPVNPNIERASSLEQVASYCAKWQEHRHDVDYQIDGVVIKVDRYQQRENLGATSRAPRWAVAYKFPPEERTALVKRIAVHTGRTGRVTPYVELEPVHVGGVMVTSATLHNEDDVRRKDVREGDTVIVHRAGDVIPEVVGPVLEKRPPGTPVWTFPRQCPACATLLVRKPGEADWRCPNRKQCPSQTVEWLCHFGSPEALDIEHLGYQTVTALVERGWVADPADLYSLNATQLLQLPGFAEKSAQNLIEAIAASKQRPLWRLLVGLNIRRVGAHVAQLLARRQSRGSAGHRRRGPRNRQRGPRLVPRPGKWRTHQEPGPGRSTRQRPGTRWSCGCPPVRRPDGGHHRNFAYPFTRASYGPGPERRRARDVKRVQENQLRGGGTGGWIQARQGSGTRHRDHR